MSNTGDNGQSRLGTTAKAGSGKLASLLDRKAALTRLGGDEQLYADLVTFFREDGPPLFEQIRSALAAGDHTALHHAAHTLKGQAANIGASAVIDASTQLDEAARQKNMAAAPAIVVRLEHALAELMQALNE